MLMKIQWLTAQGEWKDARFNKRGRVMTYRSLRGAEAAALRLSANFQSRTRLATKLPDGDWSLNVFRGEYANGARA